MKAGSGRITRILRLTAQTSKNLFIFIEDKSGPVLLAALMLVLAIQVAGRTLGFGARLTWTDETARILFVWSVFLSLPLASKRGAMVRIGVSEKLWPAFLRPRTAFMAAALWNLTALALALLSLANIMAHRHYPQLTPVLRLNLNDLFLVIPLAFLMVFIRGIHDFIKKAPTPNP
jgi:TRAP-type C4-dicarboxylate transport system permease small subunit